MGIGDHTTQTVYRYIGRSGAKWAFWEPGELSFCYHFLVLSFFLLFSLHFCLFCVSCFSESEGDQRGRGVIDSGSERNVLMNFYDLGSGSLKRCDVDRYI